MAIDNSVIENAKFNPVFTGSTEYNLAKVRSHSINKELEKKEANVSIKSWYKRSKYIQRIKPIIIL